MNIQHIPTTPFDDQRPGTAGLRKKVAQIQQPHYLENFLQAIFSSTDLGGQTLVIGGDGRYYNDEAIQRCLQVAAGNGITNFIIGQNGLLSTPAASHVIRHYGAGGGLILSASHNPAGPAGDFGIKFNIANGGQASESLTESIYERSQSLTQYRLVDLPEIDLSQMGSQQIDGIQIQIIDPVADYAHLMQGLFDFDRIADRIRQGFRLRYDAMHAVTGPYAEKLFSDLLGAEPKALLNCKPSADFNGGHPDPNLKYAADLVDSLMQPDGPDFGAASDGDGDRNMILGKGLFVSPGDSLAMLADNLTLCPGYTDGLNGAARSMPTSRALDRVASARAFPAHETPTGWRFFCNLLDAGEISLCGEESFGTGSDHVREKDGLWAVLAWLDVLAARNTSVADLARQHWHRYGRHYYQRQDFEGLDTAAANDLVEALRSRLPTLEGQSLGQMSVSRADEFAYHDPVDGSHSPGQGIRIEFEEDARVVVRLSGTGTSGATLRLYLERYAPPGGDHQQPVSAAVRDLAQWATKMLRLTHFTGRQQPDVVT